jgi:hypothetical protein
MLLASPLSAGALYQFLSSQRPDRGLKIKHPYSAPVLKIREKSEPLSEEQRKAWTFHLKEMYQRQIGTKEAEYASAQIESFLKSDAARATAGTLLGPVKALMDAEQAYIRQASSIVRRWMANEHTVQEIATATDDREVTAGQITQYKNALTFARQLLARFPDFQHGEIDIELVRDRAYSLGSVLSDNDMQHLQRARVVIAKHAQQLADYIGPEVALLIQLCMKAKGASVEQYRTDAETKTLCSSIATALRARTDTDEYIVPVSPRNTARRTDLKASAPSITGYSADTAHLGNGGRMPAPSSRTGGGKSSGRVDTDPDLPTSPVTTSRSLPRSLTDSASGAVVMELKGQQKAQLGHSATVTEGKSPQQGADFSPYRPMQPRQSSGHGNEEAASKGKNGHARNASSAATATNEPEKKSRQEKRKLRRSMQYAAPPLDDAEHGRKHRSAEKEKSSQAMEKPDRPFKEKRKAQKWQRLSHPAVIETKALQQQSPLNSKAEGKIATGTDITRNVTYAALRNNAFDEKWHALQSRVGGKLQDYEHAVVSKMLPSWNIVDMHRLDKASFSSVVISSCISREDRLALISLRDTLLDDSLKGTQALAPAVFPELLTLVIYSIDAHRKLPKEIR